VLPTAGQRGCRRAADLLELGTVAKAALALGMVVLVG
jgi:hypothetical protein